jgi:deferrochelatase/peroxidase EfeB
LLVALELTTAEPAATRAAIERLRELLHAELRSDLDDTTPRSPKDTPSVETGELGFEDGFDRYHLTITVGFGAAAYDKLGVAAGERPADLIPVPWERLKDAPDNATNGDIVLQICSESFYVAEHVLRRVEHHLADVMTVTWVVAGHQRHTSRAGRVNRAEGRALIGFLDGTSNLDPRQDRHDRDLVFVDPDPKVIAAYPPQVPVLDPAQPSPYGGPQPPQFPDDLRLPPTAEPKWTKEGTYMVVRASTIALPAWDDVPLGAQEHAVGRWKVSGNALDQPDDPNAATAEPNFGADPDGATTPFTAHVRKVNPRGPDDAARRIFRRGYPLIAAGGASAARGLVFICFARTLTTQFEFITRAWTTNEQFPRPGAGVDALRAFEHVLFGGYFFVPPLQRAHEPWSWLVPA